MQGPTSLSRNLASVLKTATWELLWGTWSPRLWEEFWRVRACISFAKTLVMRTQLLYGRQSKKCVSKRRRIIFLYPYDVCPSLPFYASSAQLFDSLCRLKSAILQPLQLSDGQLLWLLISSVSLLQWISCLHASFIGSDFNKVSGQGCHHSLLCHLIYLTNRLRYRLAYARFERWAQIELFQGLHQSTRQVSLLQHEISIRSYLSLDSMTLNSVFISLSGVSCLCIIHFCSSCTSIHHGRI